MHNIASLPLTPLLACLLPVMSHEDAQAAGDHSVGGGRKQIDDG